MGNAHWKFLAGLTLAAVCSTPAAAQAPLNPELRVGIVQRFGEEFTDQLVLTPLGGDQLTVSFETGGQPQTIQTQELTILIGAQPLPEPVLEERVVLSSHRSFESAEESASRWQRLGIATEVAQPDAWQVWAKRTDYHSPLLRRLLLESLHAAGHGQTFIDSQVLTARPQVAFVANGYRYNRSQFDITSRYRRVQLQTNGARKRLFGGDLRLQPNTYGTYTLVNQVPIETYLRGVVPHEIGPSAPPPAVEAQAVLARTYALRNLRRFAIDDYELCADTQCQVYRGLSDTVERADRAIAATQGQVLTYNGELIDALYSSTTGGISAKFSDVWNGFDRPYLTPVVDSINFQWDLAAYPLSDETNFRRFINLQAQFNEEDWHTFRWQRQATLEEIATSLGTYLTNRSHPLAKLTSVSGLAVTERAASGRVQTVTVSTNLGPVELRKNEIISALIPPRSQLFYIEPTYEAPQQSETSTATSPKLTGYRFIGGGFGHGVGMSQTGSYHLGEQGWPYQKILQFYYPNTKLQLLDSSIVLWRPPNEDVPADNPAFSLP